MTATGDAVPYDVGTRYILESWSKIPMHVRKTIITLIEASINTGTGTLNQREGFGAADKGADRPLFGITDGRTATHAQESR